MAAGRQAGLAALLLLTSLASISAQRQVLIDCEYNTRAPCRDLKNGSDGQLLWEVAEGPTMSEFTGPNAGVDSKYYIYVEATKKTQGHWASLESKPLGATGPICVDFYYHMYGEEMGSLSLSIRQGGYADRVIWSQHGDQGNKWIQHTVMYDLTNKMQRLVWKGVRGSEYRGDIGLDNIKVSTFACTDVPNLVTTPRPAPVAYQVRVQPEAIWVPAGTPGQVTCGVNDPEYLSPIDIKIVWYFPNGTKIPGDNSSPGVLYNYAYSPNASVSSLGWWRSTLFVDANLDHTLSGKYICKVTYGKYATTTAKGSIFFQGCRKSFFSCAWGESCVPCSMLCDTVNDCGDWSDELGCGVGRGPAATDSNCSS